MLVIVLGFFACFSNWHEIKSVGFLQLLELRLNLMSRPLHSLFWILSVVWVQTGMMARELVHL